jgi:hypothetical protein
MADQWFYARGGQQTGPVTFAQLTDVVRAGGLTPSDLVWQEGTPEWQPASQVPGLFGAVAAAPATLPPPPAGPYAQSAPLPAQPVGYQGPYQPQFQQYPPGSVPNYLVQSILVTIFCCWPFGIPAIVYAAQVNSKLAVGDYQGAVDSSNKAKMWSWISFGLTAVFGGLYLVIIIIAAATS